jgi:hypothetical protein
VRTTGLRDSPPVLVFCERCLGTLGCTAVAAAAAAATAVDAGERLPLLLGQLSTSCCAASVQAFARAIVNS